MSRLSSAVLAACAVAALPSCAVDDGPGTARAELIAQAPDFYFLPPIVPPPAQFGDFLPELSPVVIAEQLDPADGQVLATLATFTRGGPVGARVNVHLQDGLPDDGDADPTGYFVARFRTAAYPLAGGDLLRFRVVLDGRELGSADVKVVTRRRERLAIDRSQYGFVVAGDVLRVKFRIDRGAIAADSDGDGVADADDVCPATYDPDQLDSVGDGVGDACRCDAVVCEPSHAGCVPGACAPTTGACGPELCIEDAPATFAGHVRGQSYGIVGGATVLLTSPTGATVHALTDQDGAFSVQVPFADATVLVSASGFESRVDHLVFDPASEAIGYEYLLVPNSAWLTVTVWGGVSEPLSGATVRVAFDNGDGASGTTGLDGTVELSLLPLGVGLDITVDAPGRPSGHLVLGHLEPGANTVVFGLY